MKVKLIVPAYLSDKIVGEGATTTLIFGKSRLNSIETSASHSNSCAWEYFVIKKKSHPSFLIPGHPLHILSTLVQSFVVVSYIRLRSYHSRTPIQKHSCLQKNSENSKNPIVGLVSCAANTIPQYLFTFPHCIRCCFFVRRD